MNNPLGGGNGNTGTTRTAQPSNNTGRYTQQQVVEMCRWIDYYNSQIGQWNTYRTSVIRYWNDPNYYQWARNEYNKANQMLGQLQNARLKYQSALRATGQL